MADIFSEAKLGPITLRNRVIKAATYEGLSFHNRVTQDLIDYHVAPARGGVGMTTVAYLAVSPDGRTDLHQVVWSPEAMPGLRKLTEAVHAEGAAVSAQIGHAGPVANGKVNKARCLAPSRFFQPQAMQFAKVATHADIERVIADHARAARMAIEAGFDAVEVHLGHTYLASAFLNPKLNRRTDEYGGSLANRAKVALGITRAVREAVGDKIAIIAKLNMTDGVKGGISMDESIQTAQWLEASGDVDALEMTAGSSLLNPMYLFRGKAPIKEFAAVMPQPVRFAMGFVGKQFLKEYPYEDLYLLERAKQVRAELTLPMILLGGVVDKPGMDQAMADGFEFVAMARALLREPDLIKRIAADSETPSLCIHCNRCMPTNFTGTHCPEIAKGARTANWTVQL